MMGWYAYECGVQRQGFSTVCGIDEVGRGPLAGPVFAAAVTLPQHCEIDGLNDSEKLNEKRRELFFDQIQQQTVSYSIAFATEQEIDSTNILQATFLAMNRALSGLSVPSGYALADGSRDPHLPVPTTLVIKGDTQNASIAAASVLAKVSHDRLTTEIDKLYPEYQSQKHKGYGTALRRGFLLKHGPCPVYRRSFLKKILGEGSIG